MSDQFHCWGGSLNAAARRASAGANLQGVLFPETGAAPRKKKRRSRKGLIGDDAEPYKRSIALELGDHFRGALE